MKWNNKGHEFDTMYQNINNKKKLYLFGAGDYGKQFIKIVPPEFQIIGFIDNSKQKQRTVTEGYPCYPLEELQLKPNEGIIVTMSQIARVLPLEQLKKYGYKKDIDYFTIEEFISVYNVYKNDKVYFSSISFLPSTICNLNCRNCLNFNPFAKSFYQRNIDELKKDVDLFFSCIDHIMLFHISGGEPMLYKYTAELIEYIDKNYGNRIDTLRTVTNGTVIPKEDTLKALAETSVEITVDDYRKAIPQFNGNFDKLIDKLNEYGIKHYINTVDRWIDLAPEKTDLSKLSDSKLIEHRDRCNQSWQELRNGKLYNCNYAAYAQVAGIAGEQDLEETYDLTAFTPDQKKELIEFRLGYTEKGYTEFCKKCRGFTPENKTEVEPAVQVAKRGL